MKKSEKKMVLILALIAIAIIVVLIVVRNNQKPEIANDGEAINKAEEFVTRLEDGTRVNTSKKLHETKKFEGLEISDLQVTENGNLSIILATVKNTSSTATQDMPITMKFIDKQGNEITTTHGYIGALQPGEETQLNTSTTFDYANAYDFIIARNN